MNKEQATGEVDVVKGKVREKVGKAPSDKGMQADGLKDYVKGNAKQVYGDAKEDVNKRVDKVPHEYHRKLPLELIYWAVSLGLRQEKKER